jgi:hypothetical protein
MKKLLTVLLVVAFALVTAAPALAQGPTTGQATTEAVVTGAGKPPIIKAKWEWSPNDDPSRPGIQIWPNPAGPKPGQGGQTEIWVWAVVTDTNGIGDITGVYFKVFEPGGDRCNQPGPCAACPEPNVEKVQVHMVKETNWEAAKQHALATGQLTPAQAAELDEELSKHAAEMWVGSWVYEVHQPAGDYCIEVTAVDQAGNKTKLGDCILIESIVVLAIDFDTVDFGEIVPRAEKWVMGNDTFEPGDGRPTVWNQGNDPASLRVHFTPMVGAQEGKTIEQFNVQLMSQRVDLKASEWATLEGPILPCTPVQIDFSIHPPEFLPADSYSGTVELEMVHYAAKK